MRVGVALLLIVLFGGFGVYAQESPAPVDGKPGGDWYQGKPIRDIVFEGLRSIRASEMDGIMEPFIGSA
ncbi:MAG: hypothetical protein LBK63_09555, partial [Treponema sp.]|nr:hypothetical protein [Treponema sp.]